LLCVPRIPFRDSPNAVSIVLHNDTTHHQLKRMTVLNQPGW
jgi:hypothetical protein